MSDQPQTSCSDPILAPFQALERFLGGLVHDLNNPLAGIIGYAQLARAEPDGDRQARYLDAIKSQADVIREALSDLVALSATHAPPEDVIGVEEVLGVAQLRTSELAHRLGVRMTISVPPNLPAIRGDLEALARATAKLVENALAAARSGSDDTSPEVIITLKGPVSGALPSGRRSIAIEVADNGPGFPPEVAGRAFDATVTSRRSRSGVGLGLSVAYAIAFRHGGTVTIDSPGPGTRVSLRLPVR